MSKSPCHMASAQSRCSSLVELALTPASLHPMLEIALENGRRLRIAPDSDACLVLRWVRLLEATC